jgi:N-dimethylarginine dimethylaminohydrolase
MADTVDARAYGGQTMVERLGRVLVRRPPADTSDWQRFGWRGQPDPARLGDEHEQFCRLLADAGAEVVVAPATTLDAIYAFDPAIVADAGAVLLRPGKPERADEVEALAGELERAGVPVAARLEVPALAEGGDTAAAIARTGPGSRRSPRSSASRRSPSTSPTSTGRAR